MPATPMLKPAAAGLPHPGHVLPARLWRAAEGVAYQCLHAPFVSALAHGTLPTATFKEYVAQDAHFLRHFDAAYGAAMAKPCAAPPFVQSTLGRLRCVCVGAGGAAHSRAKRGHSSVGQWARLRRGRLWRGATA